MTPYYEDSCVTLYCGNDLTVLHQLPATSILVGLFTVSREFERCMKARGYTRAE